MSDAHVEVTVQRSGQPERRFTLRAGVAHAGRAEDNEVVLADMGVSRRHVRLRVEDQKIHVEDLGSGNGTYYRGNRVQQVDLADGDQLYIDPFTVTFRFVGEKAAAPRRATKSLPPRPARLVTLAGVKLEAQYALPPSGLTMGRSNQREVVLFDPAASRLQAQILWKDDGWYLSDEASANGTYVNGERATLHRLRAGDRVRVGATEFRFEEEGEEAASPSPTRSSAPAVPVLPPAPQRSLAPGLGPAAPRGPLPAAGAAPVVPSGPTLVTAGPAPGPVVAPAPAPGPVVAPAPGPVVAPAPAPQAVTLPPASPLPAPLPPHGAAPSRPAAAAPAAASGGLNWLVLLGFAGFGLLAVSVSVLLVWLAVRPDALRELQIPGREPAAVAPAPSPELQKSLAEGRALLDQGRPLEAMARFYEVRKRDPENDEAERMLYLSGETILLDALRQGIVTRSSAPPPRR